MSNIVFRLPGREMYSFAEVTFTAEEYTEPGPYPIADLLKRALDDLNATFPSAAGSGGNNQGGGGFQSSASSQTRGEDIHSCQHGQRVVKEGRSAKGPWKAYMCPERDPATRCKPIDAKTGKLWS